MTKFQLFLTYLLLFVVHLLIGISFFDYLGSGSEMAGSLIRLGKKSHMIFYAMIFPLIILGIYYLINRIIQHIYIGYLIITGLSFVSVFFYRKDCYTQIKPDEGMSSDEYIKYQKKQLNIVCAEIQKKMNHVVIFTPHDSVLTNDKKEILQIVRNEWDNFYSPLIKERPYNIKLLNRINNLMALYYSEVENDSIIKKYKNTLEVNYILYGPGYHSFIAVLTYDGESNPTDKYSHIILLCNKVYKKIYAYAFTEHNQTGYDTGFSRELVKLKGLQKVFSYRGKDYAGNNNYGFGGYLLKLKKEENPPSIYFWNSKGVRNLFKYTSDSTIPNVTSNGINNTDTLMMNLPVIVYSN